MPDLQRFLQFHARRLWCGAEPDTSPLGAGMQYSRCARSCRISSANDGEEQISSLPSLAVARACCRERHKIVTFRFANKLDFVGDRREYPHLFLLPWCLSVFETSRRVPSPAKSDTESTNMTAIPAEVVSAHKLLDQYHVIVRIGHYQGLFATLVFGDNKPFIGACHESRVDLIYLHDPGLCAGQGFPLWSIQ